VNTGDEKRDGHLRLRAAASGAEVLLVESRDR